MRKKSVIWMMRGTVRMTYPQEYHDLHRMAKVRVVTGVKI